MTSPPWTSRGYSTSPKALTGIHNPITAEELATLGAALRMEPGTRVLDLGSGSGEMLCTWARDHGVVGTGIDLSALFTEQAKRRAVELGVADRVEFIHGDAAGHVSDEKVDVAACLGATWIDDGLRSSRHSHAAPAR
jgi:ubiquinone/menaquinone biosynthesis C-methylase UbiE